MRQGGRACALYLTGISEQGSILVRTPSATDDAVSVSLRPAGWGGCTEGPILPEGRRGCEGGIFRVVT